MTIKLKIKHEAIQKVYHLHNGISPHLTWSHIFIFTLSLPVYYSPDFTKKL